MNVLVVDDNATNRRLLRAILESEDNVVTEAADGVEALAALETAGADAVISDILMPNMDGYRLCYEVRDSERFCDVPFILCSSTYVSEADKKLSLELGADLYLHKPVSAQVIFDSLRELTKDRRQVKRHDAHPNPDLLRRYSDRVGSKLDEVHSELEAKGDVLKVNVALEKSNQKLREFDRFKTEFLATASHEMRTPLAIIREFASLMADKVAGPINGEQSSCLNSIVRNCDRLTSLIDDLLDLASIEAGKMEVRRERLDIATLLLECVADFVPRFKTKSQSLVCDLGMDGLPAVLADRSKIQQVLVNLIGNAHKFVQAGGHISVRARRLGNSLCIQVIDDGPGMDQSALKTVFDAFTQINREDGPGKRGTGLGLTITRKIIQLHNGDISVTSEVNKGTTFTFDLPLFSAQSDLEAFVVDQTRGAQPDVVTTLVAVAAVQVEVDILAIKSLCDSAMPLARSAKSISDRGMLLYSIEGAKAASRQEIQQMLDVIPKASETLIFEKGKLDLKHPAKSLARIQSRLEMRHVKYA